MGEQATNWKPAASNQESTSGKLSFVRASELAEAGKTGVVAEGTFVRATPNKYDESKLDYFIQDDSGNTVCVNSTGDLARQMKSVALGSLVQIIYNGMEKINSGKLKGKSIHKFLVNIAE